MVSNASLSKEPLYHLKTSSVSVSFYSVTFNNHKPSQLHYAIWKSQLLCVKAHILQKINEH